MGTLTETFANLSDYLLSQYKTTRRRGADAELVLAHVLKPFLPAAVRCGPGTVTDIKDRTVGPFTAVASADNFPPFSEGAASTYLSDGVIFALDVKNWKESDLSQFGETARLLKKMEGKRKKPIPCLAVSFEPLPLPELSQLLSSKSGDSIDGIVCIGHHAILRNSQGWYGDPKRIPFVTERPGAEALKSFTFFLLQLSQTAIGQPFGLADFQHL